MYAAGQRYLQCTCHTELRFHQCRTVPRVFIDAYYAHSIGLNRSGSIFWTSLIRTGSMMPLCIMRSIRPCTALSSSRYAKKRSILPQISDCSINRSNILFLHPSAVSFILLISLGWPHVIISLSLISSALPYL